MSGWQDLIGSLALMLFVAVLLLFTVGAWAVGFVQLLSWIFT